MTEDASQSIEGARELADLFRQNFPWLVRYLGRKLGSIERGEDAASEVFVRVARRWNVDTLLFPRAYLLVVARRLIGELRGRGMLEQAYLEALSYTPEISSASPEAVVSHIQEVRVIDAALTTVTPRARLAFVMHHIDGKTHAEIAEHLGVSISMIRKYIATSEQKCRANLTTPKRN